MVLGKNIPLNVTDTRNIGESGGIGNWKLNHRVPVAGYWRVQHYGSEQKEDKRSEVIWIDDYVKGPELADVISKKVQLGYF